MWAKTFSYFFFIPGPFQGSCLKSFRLCLDFSSLVTEQRRRKSFLRETLRTVLLRQTLPIQRSQKTRTNNMDLILATRPWSFTAAAVPILVAGAAVSPVESPWSVLLTWPFARALTLGIAVQAGTTGYVGAEREREREGGGGTCAH